MRAALRVSPPSHQSLGPRLWPRYGTAQHQANVQLCHRLPVCESCLRCILNGWLSVAVIHPLGGNRSHVLIPDPVMLVVVSASISVYTAEHAFAAVTG